MVLYMSTLGDAPVAQLDRVFDYESKGRGFESLPAYQVPIQCIGTFYFGPVAQLGERCVRNAEVKSSILSGSTTPAVSNSRTAGFSFAYHKVPATEVRESSGVIR